MQQPEDGCASAFWNDNKLNIGPTWKKACFLYEHFCKLKHKKIWKYSLSILDIWNHRNSTKTAQRHSFMHIYITINLWHVKFWIRWSKIRFIRFIQHIYVYCSAYEWSIKLPWENVNLWVVQFVYETGTLK